MPSTYSTNLAIQLIATGDQAGTWGSTTNTNLGTLIEQAISGYVTQAISDGGDTTLTMTDGASCTARNMFLELTGTLTAARNLIVPANKKLYFIYNNTLPGDGAGFAVTVKVSGQTGVSVANGQKIVLVSNGTDTVVATTNAAIYTTITDAGNYYTSTNVEGALQEAAQAVTTKITDVGAYYTSTNVEGALQEAAQAVTTTITDAGSYYTSTNVEGALQEVGAKTGAGGAYAFGAVSSAGVLGANKNITSSSGSGGQYLVNFAAISPSSNIIAIVTVAEAPTSTPSPASEQSYTAQCSVVSTTQIRVQVRVNGSNPAYIAAPFFIVIYSAA